MISNLLLLFFHKFSILSPFVITSKLLHKRIFRNFHPKSMQLAIFIKSSFANLIIVNYNTRSIKTCLISKSIQKYTITNLSINR